MANSFMFEFTSIFKIKFTYFHNPNQLCWNLNNQKHKCLWLIHICFKYIYNRCNDYELYIYHIKLDLFMNL
jgi:hypothetical protein